MDLASIHISQELRGQGVGAALLQQDHVEREPFDRQLEYKL